MGTTPPPAEDDSQAKPASAFWTADRGAPSASSDPDQPPPACLGDDAVAVPDCRLPPPDPSCPANTFPAQKCATFRAYYDSRVAAAAISCLTARTSAQLCDPSATYSCSRRALKQACPNTTVDSLCGIAVTSCRAKKTDCVAMLSGVNDAGKKQIARCISQGCPGGLYSCVEGLTASTP
jgi:hypothetical protein